MIDGSDETDLIRVKVAVFVDDESSTVNVGVRVNECSLDAVLELLAERSNEGVPDFDALRTSVPDPVAVFSVVTVPLRSTEGDVVTDGDGVIVGVRWVALGDSDDDEVGEGVGVGELLRVDVYDAVGDKVIREMVRVIVSSSDRLAVIVMVDV